MITVTFEQIVNFNRHANFYMQTMGDKQSKLTYALKKVSKQFEKIFEDYNEELQDIQIDHASTDADGNLATGEKGEFKFTPEKLKARKKAEKACADKWQSKEFEVKTHFVTELPEGLYDDQIEAFEFFVIEPQNELTTA